MSCLFNTLSQFVDLNGKELRQNICNYMKNNPVIIDQIRIEEDCTPVGDVFGIPIYEATHMKTNQKIFITVNEIYR